MGISLTLIIQMAVFAFLVWFAMRYIWPPLIRALDEREKKISDGLAAGERGERDLELAQEKCAAIMREARQEASNVVESAHERAGRVMEEAKADAVAERERQLAVARSEIEQETNRAREDLRKQVAGLAVSGAERLIEKEMDESTHRELLDDLVKKL